MVAKAKLNLFHVKPKATEEDWTDFPGVRSTLEQWGILPVGSKKEEVEKLGIGIQKVLGEGQDPATSILMYMEQQPTDLIVMTTNQRVGFDRWLQQVVAEAIARHTAQHTKVMTLFIPSGKNGFVSPQDGKVHLDRILIPVDQAPHPQRAIDVSSRLAQIMECTETEFAMLHVSTTKNFPVVDFPMSTRGKWSKISRTGSVVEEILSMANEYSADLIVMPTVGQAGFWDALRGSTMERVLREASCPLLAVPVL